MTRHSFLADRMGVAVLLASFTLAWAAVAWLVWIAYFVPIGWDMLVPAAGYLIYGLAPLGGGIVLGGCWGRWWRWWCRRGDVVADMEGRDAAESR